MEPIGARPAGLKGNIVDYLFETSLQRGGDYLISPDRTWTFAQIADRVGRIGNYLKSIGLQPGQRVLFSVVDGVDFASLFLATMKIGAIAIPINTYLKPQDYAYYIRDSECMAVVVDHSLAPMIVQLRATFPAVKHVIATGRRVANLPFLDEDSDRQDEQCESHATNPDDMAFWLYSSGSTGNPKGVVHTGNHIYWATELFGSRTMKITERDVILCPPKMYFAFGLGCQIYFPLRRGAQNIVNPDPISPDAVWKQWLDHEPTVIIGVPTLFAALLRIAEEKIGAERVRHASRRLRYCVSGGEVLPAALMQRWKAFANVQILDGVGTTEMTHMFMLNDLERPVPGSCGCLVKGYRAELVDDQNQPVPQGEIGNLRAFGPTAALSYWNKPEKTKEVMGGGGVLTGDKMYQDADGNFFLVGRSDDMLRVGGIWVSPAEVESVIAQHDAVLECAVVGIPDAEDMIKPKAFVVLRNGGDKDQIAEQLRSHVRERLAHIKCPRWFEFIDELPKTSTGKIQRFRLRQQGAAQRA
ncbi:MAG: benzoate-CoA ligase family protein [Proteobacteria bacterium]|nr:benzoate-CoA ligase family protein [Pseudomonadota bacterium]